MGFPSSGGLRPPPESHASSDAPARSSRPSARALLLSFEQAIARPRRPHSEAAIEGVLRRRRNAGAGEDAAVNDLSDALAAEPGLELRIDEGARRPFGEVRQSGERDPVVPPRVVRTFHACVAAQEVHERVAPLELVSDGDHQTAMRPETVDRPPGAIERRLNMRASHGHAAGAVKEVELKIEQDQRAVWRRDRIGCRHAGRPLVVLGVVVASSAPSSRRMEHGRSFGRCSQRSRKPVSSPSRRRSSAISSAILASRRRSVSRSARQKPSPSESRPRSGAPRPRNVSASCKSVACNQALIRYPRRRFRSSHFSSSICATRRDGCRSIR